MQHDTRQGRWQLTSGKILQNKHITKTLAQSHQGREFIANGALENSAFCTVFSENFHKF
jgi:hypothetical protein